MSYLIALKAQEALRSDLVGHKFASLAQAAQKGVRVPLAVCIPVQAHAHFRDCGQWLEQIWSEITKAALDLGLKDQGVAVRSSGTLEDLADSSFAGQYETYLNICDEQGLQEAVEACWESADSDRIKAYWQHKTHGSMDHALIGVILQQMVHPQFAGVIFSHNPLDNSGKTLLVEVVQGMADSLVSGERTPLRVSLSRSGVPQDMPSSQESMKIPPREIWPRLTGIVLIMEDVLNSQAIDMEWALDTQNTLWVLQARPITTSLGVNKSLPTGCWTRKIADDLWADRLTPFLARVMMKNRGRFDMTRLARTLGISLVHPPLTVMYGYLYVNCQSLLSIVSYLPTWSRSHDIRQLFPPHKSQYDPDSIPGPSVTRLLLLGIRVLWFVIRYPRSNPIVCLWLTRWWMFTFKRRIQKHQDLDSASPQECLEITRQMIDALGELQEKNQFPYFFATVFTWMLRWLLLDCQQRDETTFWGFVQGQSNNVSLKIEREFQRLVSLIREDDGLVSLCSRVDSKDLYEQLPNWFRQELDSFLDQYGVRSRHRTLLEPRWKETPEEVLSILARLVLNQGQHKEIQRKAPGRSVWNPVYAILGQAARTFLDLREDLRFVMDQILFTMRQSLMALAREYGLSEQIFFLQESELEDLVTGRIPLAEAKDIAKMRKQDFDRHMWPPPFVVDGQPEYGPQTSGAFRGVGTSPGRVTGRANVIIDLSQATIQSDDIVITRHTDPGWTPVLSNVRGVVTEEGGLLNHCSIVARELNIPSVVGVAEVTRKVPHGSKILIDGSTGELQILGD
jgi:pyruvate,water dikinase